MSQCDDVTAYLLGDMSEVEERRFRDHLTQCLTCQQDVEGLAPISDRLLESEDSDLVLSPDLKANTLAAAFAARKPIPRTRKHRAWGWKSLTSTAAALIVGIAVGRWAPASKAPDESRDNPAQMLREMALKSSTAVQNSSGMAMTYKQGSQVNLVVYVENMRPLDNWGCYSVWVTTHGKRTNLGDFTVNQKGDAVFSVTLPSQSDTQTLQITREPTWNDHTPQGPAVLLVRNL